MESKLQTGGKYSCKPHPQEGLESGIYKDRYHYNSKITNKSNKKWANYMKIFHIKKKKKEYPDGKEHEKMPNSIKHWRSTDQNCSKTSSPTYQNG